MCLLLREYADQNREKNCKTYLFIVAGDRNKAQKISKDLLSPQDASEVVYLCKLLQFHWELGRKSDNASQASGAIV